MTDMMLKKLGNGREYRSMVLEVRAAEDDSKMIVEGYATTFGKPYVLHETKNYKVMEQVDAHAFDNCDMSDVIFQYDHEGRVFARTRNKTLELSVDHKGLLVRADLSGTDEGKKLYQEIAGGYTDRMSFGFVVAEDKREYVEDVNAGTGTYTRTITKISKLYDVSAVSIPANDMTSISARKFSDGVIAEFEAERLLREKKKKLRLLMEVTK